jgi:transcriptional regulator with XRE-family HTH domain
MLAVGKQAELMNKLDVGTAVGSFGDFVRERRRSAQLSLRQLAEQTGVSNPYLSQIERGLRKPSAHVLQQLAKALRVSAETMYVRAGMLDPDEDGARSVELAVLSDIGLTERQKTVLLDIYSSFRREVADAAEITEPSAEATHATDEGDG